MRQRSLIPHRDIPEPAQVQEAVQNNRSHRDLRAMAAAWIRENPEAYLQLLDLARRLASQGQERLSINALFEELRARGTVTYRRTGFKLDNDLRPYVARRIVADVPGLEKLFQFRKTKW